MLSCVAQGRVLDGSFRSHYNNVGFQDRGFQSRHRQDRPGRRARLTLYRCRELRWTKADVRTHFAARRASEKQRH